MTTPEISRTNLVTALVLVAACLFLYGWGAGSYSLWDPWEPKYAQTIREMGERGELLTPYLNDKVRWTKPILIYWAMKSTVAVFGESELAYRMPSIIGATLCVLFVFGFVTRLRDRSTGLMAACALATMPQFFYMARQAMPDMLLTLFITASMGFLALGRFSQDRRRLWFLLFWASFGLAVLTKGPVAGVVTLAALGLFWAVDLEPWAWKSWRDPLRSMGGLWREYHAALGLGVFVLVAAPWYLAILVQHGDTFVDSFIMGENLHRFTEPVREHHGTAEYYLRHFFHAMYPWSSLLPVGLFFLFYGRKSLDDESRQRWYWLSWCFSIFVVFTLSGTKLDHYILPILPVVAILVALVWERYFSEDSPFWVGPAFLLAIPFALMPIRDFLLEGDRYIFNVFNNARDIDYPGLPTALKIFLAAWAVVMLAAATVRRSRGIAALSVIVAFVGAAYMNHRVLPAHTSSRSMLPYIERFQELAPSDAELVFFGKIRYTATYYAGETVIRHFERGELKELVAHLRGKPDVYMIARSSDMGRSAGAIRSGTGTRWFVVANDHPRYVLMSNVAPRPNGGE